MDRALRRKILGLLDGQKLGILATLGRDYPYQNIVAFAAGRDLKSICFATRRDTSKYRNLKRRKRVAMFIDDRLNREADFHDATGLSALGVAEELRGEGHGRSMKLLRRKHPELKEFFSAPDCVLFAIRVRVFYLVMRFQDVIEVRIQ
jgi:nitroimidazol reductase NimA-like FMN-containing flavoprotein (pyridoxamine 5'-phosphate oxidase superfamily)